MKGIWIAAAALMAAGFWGVSSVAAYQEAPVADGGTVSGKVAFKGTPPPAEHFRVQKNPEVCGTERDFFHVTVKDGALLHTVVLIEGVEKGKPVPPKVVDITGKNCAFLPYVTVVPRIERLDFPVMKVVNEDTVIHNPHTFEMIGKARVTLWNIGLPDKGSKLEKELKLKKGDTVKLQCDQHDFMHAWTKTASNPYYAVVGADGKFSIDQVPPGKYKIVAWHPILGEQTQEITVATKGKTDANFTFSAQ
jgi:hypothetical protein